MQGVTCYVNGWGGAVRGSVFGGRDAVEVFAGVYKGGGHTELAHVFEQDAVVGCVEGALEVVIHDLEILVVDLAVLHHHDDGGESVVYVAAFPESILMVAKDDVSFCLL
jgi:hypothetical protein